MTAGVERLRQQDTKNTCCPGENESAAVVGLLGFLDWGVVTLWAGIVLLRIAVCSALETRPGAEEERRLVVEAGASYNSRKVLRTRSMALIC